jgi:spore coat polysaccharide biosynthesis protein SpsF
MGSSRLPGKVLASLGRRKLLDEVVARARAVPSIDCVVVATSSEVVDDAIAEHCTSKGVSFFRGSELDVLDRFFQAALAYDARHIVRLTADNPLFDPASMHALVLDHLEKHYDYTHAVSAWGCRLPYGTGAEIFTMGALETSWREGLEPRHRDHVDEFVYEHPERFLIGLVQPLPVLRRPELRLTVDTPTDLEMMRRIFHALGRSDRLIELSEVIKFLDATPELLAHFSVKS